MSDMPNRAILNRLIGILDAAPTTVGLRGDLLKRRKLMQQLHAFNAQHGHTLALHLPIVLMPWSSTELVCTLSDLAEQLCDIKNPEARRLFTLLERQTHRVRLINRSTEQATMIDLDLGEYRSPELLRNATVEGRSFRRLLDQVKHDRRAYVVRSPRLQQYIERLPDLSLILGRVQVEMRVLDDGIEFRPLGINAQPQQPNNGLDPLVIRFALDLRARVASSSGQRLYLDAQRETRDCLLARRYLTPRLLRWLALERLDLADGSVELALIGGGARPGGLHDQPLRELIDKIQQALQTQASYQVNMLEAPDDYLLAQLYLTSDVLRGLGLRSRELSNSVVEFRAAQGWAELLEELSPAARERMNEVINDVKQSRAHRLIPYGDTEIEAFLKRPEVRQVLLREQQIRCVSSSGAGGRVGGFRFTPVD